VPVNFRHIEIEGEAIFPPFRELETGDYAMSNKLVDLSHEVEHGMITYKGLPAPIICDFLSREDSRKHYAEGTEFNIGKIEMVANTGTYVDSPFHRFADGIDLAELPLESLADLEGLLVRVQEFERTISAEAFQGLEIQGKAVLIHTNWSRHWRTDQYFEGHPFLSREAAQYLADSGAAFVGIDTYNIDDTTDGTRPAHTILLGNRIPICEHMCGLEHLPNSGFRFHAAPVKVRAFGTFPVRAYAVMDR
jgi:arylformamidase